jgi:hypothetical protein
MNGIHHRLLLTVLVLQSAAVCQAKDALDVWQQRSTTALNTVRYGAGRFVGVDNQGTVATSADGTNWLIQVLPGLPNLSGIAFRTNTTGTFLIVAVGDGGAAGGVWRSGDATNWINANPILPITNFIGHPLTAALTDIAWNSAAQLFVATARDDFLSTAPRVYYAAGTTTWTPVDLPAGNQPLQSGGMKRVACFNGVFYAAGGGGFDEHIWRSTNGIDWEYVMYANGYSGNFVQGNGLIAFLDNEWLGFPFSTDGGATWTFMPCTNICTSCYCILGYDATFGNGTFVTVGYNHTSNINGPLTSTDLIHWQVRNALAGKSLASVSYGNGTFVAVGSHGIYQSLPVSTPSLLIQRIAGTSTLKIYSSGEVGRAYRLQSSPNLSNWTDALHFTNTVPTMELVEFADPNSMAGFYRVVTP